MDAADDAGEAAQLTRGEDADDVAADGLEAPGARLARESAHLPDELERWRLERWMRPGFWQRDVRVSSDGGRTGKGAWEGSLRQDRRGSMT